MDEKKSRSKIIKIAAALAIAAVLVILGIIFIPGLISGKKKSADRESGAEIDGDYIPGDMAISGISNFTGIIEPEKSQDIHLDSERVLDQILVKKGDTVTAGQQLFTYKTEDVSLRIEQAKLELDGYNEAIRDDSSRIEELKKEQEGASEESKLVLAGQIQSLSTNIKQNELSKKTKQAEINSLNKKVSESVVTSPIDGIITNINSSSAQSPDAAFMTILSSSSYRVKGKVDEMNLGMLQEGTPVIIRSRIDDRTWTGAITKVDTESTAQDNNSMMYGSDGNTGEQSSKYYFYTSIDNPEGLIIGQHVFIEPQPLTEEYTDEGAGDFEGDPADNEDGNTAEDTDQEESAED